MYFGCVDCKDDSLKCSPCNTVRLYKQPNKEGLSFSEWRELAGFSFANTPSGSYVAWQKGEAPAAWSCLSANEQGVTWDQWWRAAGFSFSRPDKSSNAFSCWRGGESVAEWRATQGPKN